MPVYVLAHRTCGNIPLPIVQYTHLHPSHWHEFSWALWPKEEVVALHYGPVTWGSSVIKRPIDEIAWAYKVCNQLQASDS